MGEIEILHIPTSHMVSRQRVVGEVSEIISEFINNMLIHNRHRIIFLSSGHLIRCSI